MIPDDLLESVATMRKPRASGDDPSPGAMAGALSA